MNRVLDRGRRFTSRVRAFRRGMHPLHFPGKKAKDYIYSQWRLIAMYIYMYIYIYKYKKVHAHLNLSALNHGAV